jgi:hypothetical protein
MRSSVARCASRGHGTTGPMRREICRVGGDGREHDANRRSGTGARQARSRGRPSATPTRRARTSPGNCCMKAAGPARRPGDPASHPAGSADNRNRDALHDVVREAAAVPVLVDRLAAPAAVVCSGRQPVAAASRLPVPRPPRPPPSVGCRRHPRIGPGLAAVDGDIDSADRSHPDQARPSIVVRPARSTRVRVRDMKSGYPGGRSSARGSMQLSGAPPSSGC